MTHELARTANVFGIVAAALIAVPILAQTKGKIPVPGLSIDATSPTVTTRSFSVTWNSGVDTEAVTSLSWMGGSNLTGSLAVNTCGNGYTDVEYFGNSEAPPDPTTGLFLPV